MQTTLFDYSVIDNHVPKTVFLLHGTGGTKNDFMFFDELLNHQYNLIGLQGNIHEQGMSRFFKRIAEGVFDQESIREESQKLYRFIEDWKQKNGEDHSYYYVGYSNGANILLAALFYYPTVLNNLILLHPMLPFVPTTIDLSNHTVFITQGLNDPLISPAQQENLTNLLESFHCKPITKTYNDSHHITSEEIHDVTQFLLKK